MSGDRASVARIGSQEILAQLERILASAPFVEAERARGFLRLVVEFTVQGRGSEIKEYVIGVEALGRPATFDPRSDPIVRVEAGRLRSRLASYYQSEGSADPIVIDLPKGGYTPQFRYRDATTQAPATPAELRADAPLARKPSTRTLVAGSAAVLLLIAAAFLYTRARSTPPRPYVRLSVLPPEGSTFRNAAISPDGRFIAFTAESGNVTRLWVRPLDSEDVRPLAGTEGAAMPFWSPDSRSIAFFSNETLKTVQLPAGPPRVVCRVQAAFGGTWGSKGVILFAQRPNAVISRVPAEGGTPVAVTALDRAHGELAHEFPYFLPDGTAFVYSVVSRAPVATEVRAGSLDSRTSRTLLDAEPGVAYAPAAGGRAGILVFAYHGALMSQPLDAATLHLSGSATQISSEVYDAQGRAELSASSTGVLAYRPGAERRQLTWFDRDGNRLGTVGPHNVYASIRLSPQADRLAIQATDGSSGRSEIWLMDLARGSLDRLGGIDEGYAPVWAPDGRQIAFSATTPTGMVLLRQRIDEERQFPFLNAVGVYVATDWSHDGEFVAYTRFQPERGTWVKPSASSPDEKGRQFPGTGVECCATFSPVTGSAGPRWIAYTSNETGQYETFVRTFPAGDHRWQVSNRGGWMPHWSPDGRRLYYIALDGMLMSVDVEGAGAADFRTGTPRPLLDTSIQPFAYPDLPGNSYDIARDGRILVNTPAKKAAASSITILLPGR